MANGDIRPPAVAGQFYPADPGELRAAVAAYMDASGVDGRPECTAALVSPHAGYIYSGPTAGHAFARVRGKKAKRVVLLGRSHRYGFDGSHVLTSGGLQTPLGVAPVDASFAKMLAGGSDGAEARATHLQEHALEVQVPFIQEALGDVPIVPVLFGSDPDASHIRLGERLAECLDEADLVLASTDLSHYRPEKEANTIDNHSLETILGKDCAVLSKELERDTCSMCGGTAVIVAMAYARARGAEDWHLLDYRTSAAASGDYSHVVGYGAVTMEHAP